MRILVTGSAGYIGRAACAALREAGHEVQVADRYDLGPCQYDLTDEDDLESLGERPPCECIVHLAARAQALEGQERPLDYWRDNVTATENVVRLAQQWKTRRIVFASSVSVYGETSRPASEDARTDPRSLYAQSKLACEWLLRAAEGLLFNDLVVLRLANVAGAVPASGEPLASRRIIPQALAAATGGIERLILRGNPTDARDYVHLEDVCELIHWAATDRRGAGGTFNAGRGEAVRLAGVLGAVQEVTGRKVPRLWTRRPDCEPASCVGLVQASLPWKPRHDLDSIVRSAWEHFQRLSHEAPCTTL